MRNKRRHQSYIDPTVQGALLRRVTSYWLLCMMSTLQILMCWMIVTDPPPRFGDVIPKMWFEYGPVMVCGLVLLPLVLIDLTRMSNRIVGPIHRLKGALHKLANGEITEPINFRDTDFWKDIAEDFNRVVAQQTVLQKRGERGVPPASVFEQSESSQDLQACIPD